MDKTISRLCKHGPRCVLRHGCLDRYANTKNIVTQCSDLFARSTVAYRHTVRQRGERRRMFEDERTRRQSHLSTKHGGSLNRKAKKRREPKKIEREASHCSS